MAASLQRVFHQARRVALAWAGVVLLIAIIGGLLLSDWHGQHGAVLGGMNWFQVGEVIVGGLLVALTYLAVNRQARLKYAVALRTQELNDALRALEQDMAERQQAEAIASERNALLNSIFRAAPIGIGLLVERVFQEVNDRVCQMTGYTREELLGQSSRLLYATAEEFERVGRDKYAQIVDHGMGMVETQWQRKDGSSVPILLSSAAVDAGDLKRGVTFTALDITERRRSEIAEREQRRLAEALRNTAVALGSTLNMDEVLDRILINMERVLAYDAADVLLLDDTRTMAYVARHRSHVAWANVTEVLELTIPVAQARNVREMLSRRQPVIIADAWAEAEWIKNPASNWIRSNLGVPIMVSGQPLGVISVDRAQPNAFTAADAERLQPFADQVAMAIQNAQLHERVRRYADELEQRVAERTRELSAANERLQELDQLKSKFVSDVSHELRTPVTSLSLYLELMTHGKAEKRAHYLEQATGQTARLRGLIEEILDLSRLERQQTGLERHVFDLNDIVDQAFTEQQPAAETAGLALGRSRQIDPLKVQGDPGQLLRAVRNLLTNAIKYTRAGQVQVNLISDGLRAGVQVRDTGMGISAEDLPHVFERFYRGRQVAQSTTPGAGLGLAIVKEIVEAHGGTVEVESTLTVGSTFTLWLPAVVE